jgi:hypothetical protein
MRWNSESRKAEGRKQKAGGTNEIGAVAGRFALQITRDHRGRAMESK